MATAGSILVIKLAALGDFIQALGPLAAIRRHHAEAKITLLTTAPFQALAEASGTVDEVWCDDRPSALAVGKWLALRHRLRSGGFQRIYDLQTSDRSSHYFRLFWPGPAPEWSGIAAGCSHPHINPARDLMHTIERQREQLAMAGIEDVPEPDVSWAKADVIRYGLSERFALMAPGGARHRPAKRWPASCFAVLAGRFAARGIQPILLGGGDEAATFDPILETCPDAVSLAGRTDLFDLAELGRRATAAVGNDTGPMHMIAAAGCRSLVLYSHVSDPALCAQRGESVSILRRESLSELTVDEVEAELDKI